MELFGSFTHGPRGRGVRCHVGEACASDVLRAMEISWRPGAPARGEVLPGVWPRTTIPLEKRLELVPFARSIWAPVRKHKTRRLRLGIETQL